MSFRILSEIGIALGNLQVDNAYFVDQLEGEEKERKRHFLEDVAGRKIRYLADEKQTSLTLAIDAAKKAIRANHVDVKDIDMVICISHTPEYVSPSMARLVLDAIEGKESVNCFDMNVNCTGMLVAIDMADRYFRTDDKLEKVLIVQGDKNSMTRSEKGSAFWGLMSDIGCAIILEKAERGGINKRYFTMDAEATRCVVYPRDGYSKPNPMIYIDPETHIRVEEIAHRIEELCGPERMKEVKLMCISQFAYCSWEQFTKSISVSEDKIPYVGDKYGYTGASSPLLALKSGLEAGLVNRGDIIVMWTYGAGNQQVILEIEY